VAKEKERERSSPGPSSEDLVAEIGAGRVAPLYHLSGERFPIDEVVRAIRGAVLGGEESAFNFDGVEGGAGKADEILGAARTVPMLGGQRLVQVRDAHLLGEADLKRLLPYIANPSPTTCLLLVAEKADLRLKFFSEARKHGVVVKFEPLKERQAPAFVAALAERREVALEPGAAARIAETVGADRAQLASALELLQLYAGIGEEVKSSHVGELLAATRQRSIFDVTNAIGRGQRREALLVLGKMHESREPPLRILAMVARHLRQLWIAKELSERRVSQGEIAERIGAHPYFVRDIVEQGQRLGRDRLRRMHRALFVTDRGLKSSPIPDELQLDGLALALTRPERESPERPEPGARGGAPWLRPR
jgi:DNA polymerase III subunit delta